jgi:NitT/TauT family transport system substrate-binding protein
MKRILIAAVLLLSAAGAARADDAATLRLNWLIYGFHTPFYLGVEKGFYKQNGIDLTIGEGRGSGVAVQAVASGSDTFGLADGGSIISGAAKGAPARAVMGIMNSSPYAICVRKDSGITSLKGLEDKTISATSGEAGLNIFPAILSHNGMAPDAIHFLRVDAEAKLVAYLQNRVPAVLCGAENQALIVEDKGVLTLVLSYPKLGVNTEGLAIVATPDTIEKKADMVRRFIRATQMSFEAAMKDPQASVDAGMKAKPSMDGALALRQLQAGLLLVKSPYGADKPVGWMAAEDWAETLALMKQYQDLHTDMPATAFWTDDLLPK